MVLNSLAIDNTYWELFEFKESDLEFIYNHLLDLETPQTPQELCISLIEHRIKEEKINLEKIQKQSGSVYLPQNSHEIGQKIVFPALGWQKGEVIGKRPGQNPDLPSFEVIDLQLDNIGKKSFASQLKDHILNTPVVTKIDNPYLDHENVYATFGNIITQKLTENLELYSDLVQIAGRWFPRALLVDVNIGYLNLTEALLEMENGGPLSTHSILEQIELPSEANTKLAEFSLNLALQEDKRFDEVGPSGEILWFLNRLEPDGVQHTPMQLRFHQDAYDRSKIVDAMKMLETEVTDELEPDELSQKLTDEVSISIIYPHLRAGTLPLSSQIKHLFPTAFEAPRVRFTFVDGDNQNKFSGWVVRPSRYIYGLSDWYNSQNLIPGSLIKIRRSKNPGEVIIRTEKKRSAKNWIRTAIIGVDGGIVLSMQNKPISVAVNDRMAIYILDQKALDGLWEQSRKTKIPIEQTVLAIMRELSKLNPQGHVHIQELYATMNIIRRFPPGALLSILFDRPWSKHLGDLYFRLDEGLVEGGYRE